MNMRALIGPALGVATLWAMADTAMAVSCRFENNAQPIQGAMPLQISAINVGRDVPVGTEVFRQRFSVATGKAPVVICDGAPYQQSAIIDVFAPYEKAAWRDGPYAGHVYKTNLGGLGVVLKTSNGELIPRELDKRPTTCNRPVGCISSFVNITGFELILIKIDDVEPGVLRGNGLPTILVSGQFGDARMHGIEMRISGNIQVVASTCNTPNISVDMGTHQTDAFTQIGSATGWKDFAITLNNCPAFHGTYATNASSWVWQGGTNASGTGTAGRRTNNNLAFRIDPVRTAINAGNGVLSLDPSGAGSASAATGVGVQIATSTGAVLPLASVRNSGLALRTTQGNYSIPLRARYLQTSSQVTPGPANASATFTLIYQ